MSELVRITSNVDGILCLSPSANPVDIINIPKKGASHPFTEEQVRYMFLTMQVIQQGKALVDSKKLRIEFGLETEDGEKQNQNILNDEEVKSLLTGNYKKLEKVLSEITQSNILRKFVELARELKIDSKTKIDLIEKATRLKIYDDEE